MRWVASKSIKQDITWLIPGATLVDKSNAEKQVSTITFLAWYHRVLVLLNSREVLSCFKHDDNKEIWRPAARGSMIQFNICHTFSLFYSDIDRKLSFLGSSALERLLGSFFNYIIVCTNFREFFHKETEKPK